MKTIYLMRHGKPDRSGNLTLEAVSSLQKAKESLPKFSCVFCSDLPRALQTAKIFCDSPKVDTRLRERTIGDQKIFTKELWERQYTDDQAKDSGGESFQEVRMRMQEVMEEIQSSVAEDETVLVVSHAAAICAYLMLDCEVKVTDVMTKSRQITYQGTTIMDGVFSPGSYFVFSFENCTKTVRYSNEGC